MSLNSNLKKLIFFTMFLVGVFGVFVYMPGIVSAQDGGDFTGVKPLEGTGLATENDLRVIIANIIRIILGFLGTVAVMIILYGGFVYMTAAGDADKVIKAKTIIKNGLIGLAITISAFGIASFIIRAIMGATGLDTGGGRGPGSGLGSILANDVIESHYPVRDARNIPRNTKIIVTFRQNIDKTTLIDDGGTPNDLSDDRVTSNVKISRADNSDPLNESDIISRIAPDGKTFVFDPIPLLGNPKAPSMYRVTLGAGIKNIDGQPIFGSLGFYDWDFEVSTLIDLTPPQVEMVIPKRVDPPGEPLTYARNIVVQITFNEAIDPTSASGITTVEAGNDTVLNNFNNIRLAFLDAAGTKHFIEGTYSVSNLYRTVEFLTNDKCGVNACGQDVFCLPGSKSINAEIFAATLSVSPPEAAGFPYDGVVDVAGNSFDGDADEKAEGPIIDNYVWNFNTSNKIDLTPPIIEQVVPGRYSVNVPLDSNISALFSKPLFYKTLKKDNVTINDIFYWVTAESVNDGDKSNVFIGHSGLTDDTIYAPEMRSGINDLYQNCFNPCEGPTSSLADQRQRDDARRIDLQLIKNALEEYKTKFGTYFVDQSGYSGTGVGYLTYIGGNYVNSVLNKLIETTSLADKKDDLTYTDNDSGYMLYLCSDKRTYSLSATMEDTRSFSDTKLVEASCNGTGTNGISTNYGKNYVLTNFNSLDARGEFRGRDALRKQDLNQIKKDIEEIKKNTDVFIGEEGKCMKPESSLKTWNSDPALGVEGIKDYLFVHFGETFALLSTLEFDKDSDYNTREIFNFEYADGKTLDCDDKLHGLYQYCVGDCDKIQSYTSTEERAEEDLKRVRDAMNALADDAGQISGHLAENECTGDVVIDMKSCNAGLLCDDSAIPYDSWNGPYTFEAQVYDPWGNSYKLVTNYTLDNGKTARALVSAGVDGVITPPSQNTVDENGLITGRTDDVYRILCER